MKRRLNVFFSYARGAGSVLEVVPPSTSFRMISHLSVEERIQSDFQRVGDALRYGIDSLPVDEVSDEVEKSSAA